MTGSIRPASSALPAEHSGQAQKTCLYGHGVVRHAEQITTVISILRRRTSLHKGNGRRNRNPLALARGRVNTHPCLYRQYPERVATPPNTPIHSPKIVCAKVSGCASTKQSDGEHSHNAHTFAQIVCTHMCTHVCTAMCTSVATIGTGECIAGVVVGGVLLMCFTHTFAHMFAVWP